MTPFCFLKPATVALLGLALAACGGGAAAPANSAASPAPSTATTANGAAAASKPAANGSAPAAASGASQQPVVSAPASAGGSGAANLTKLTAAYSQVSAVQAPLYVAGDQGFFRKYGIDVNIVLIAGTQQVPAMTAGELQFGTPGGNELVSANLGGAPMVAIAVASNYPVFSMYGQKGVTDVNQLAGKSVAITTAGSSTDAAAQVFLKHFNLDKEVKRQPAGTIGGILATVEKGYAAAGIVSPPTTVKAAKDGLPELANGPQLGVPMTHSAVTVTRNYLKSNPQMVKAFLQGYLDGWNFTLDPANQDAVVQTLAKWTKSDEATARASYEYVLPAFQHDKVPAVNLDGLQTVLDLVDNPKAKNAKPSDFIDNSLIEALAK